MESDVDNVCRQRETKTKFTTTRWGTHLNNKENRHTTKKLTSIWKLHHIKTIGGKHNGVKQPASVIKTTAHDIFGEYPTIINLLNAKPKNDTNVNPEKS